jgi:hypothetical protein
MSEHIIRVWDKPYPVSTYQRSKSVWVASGEFMDESHSSEDRTEGTSIKRWREWARYKGNG